MNTRTNYLISEEFIKVGETKIRYLEEGGSNGNIVLIHGLGGFAERWSAVIPLLSKKYHVIALDLPGYGYSDKPSIDYTPEFFSKFIFDFLDTMGIKKTHMIGTSLGGQIVAECATTQNKMIEKIVLVCPAGIMKTSTPTLDAYSMAALYPTPDTVKTAYEMMTGSSKKVSDDAIESFIKRMTQPNAKMAFMSTILALKNAPPITERLANIISPTLLIWGKLDTMIPVKYANDFASSIKNCRLEIMENCGHTPHIEEPAKFSQSVLNFLG
ncbi:MAG TPA: alpha/beta hydrolase [Nitrosopumilaceae archaeon]|nr:alpha/beta hydrolase [Nitrosopumilaceae archaeon]